MEYIILGIISIIFITISNSYTNKTYSETVIEIAAEPAVNNEVTIYNPEIFQKLFHDLLTSVINNQEQQNIQFKVIQAQIDLINTTLFYSTIIVGTLIICGLSYYFLSPTINIPALGIDIYTQLNNQYINVSNQIYAVFNRFLGMPNVEIPVVQAEIINQNIQQVDNRFLDIITENIATNIQNQEIERLVNDIVDNIVYTYITNPTNMDFNNIHVIGQFLLENNSVI